MSWFPSFLRFGLSRRFRRFKRTQRSIGWPTLPWGALHAFGVAAAYVLSISTTGEAQVTDPAPPQSQQTATEGAGSPSNEAASGAAPSNDAQAENASNDTPPTEGQGAPTGDQQPSEPNEPNEQRDPTPSTEEPPGDTGNSTSTPITSGPTTDDGAPMTAHPPAAYPDVPGQALIPGLPPTGATDTGPAEDSIELQLARAAEERAERAAEVQEQVATEVATLQDAISSLQERMQAERVAAEAEAAAARARLAEASDTHEEAPVERNIYIPVPADADGLSSELESLVESFSQDRSLGGLLGLILGLAFAVFLTVLLRRTRERLAARGLLPSLFAFLHLAARLLVIAICVAFVVRFLPPRLSLVVLLVFAGVALAIGWSTRDFLPDLMAGIMLVFERRIRPGMWLAGPGFAGQVERVGFRAAVLRDAHGCEVNVPNRALVTAPLSSDAHREREHDVTLRIDEETPAKIVRQCIVDAVLSSPWVAPGHRPLVFRDPDEPWLWRVRARLLKPQFGVRFEGELLERTEAALAWMLPQEESS